MRFTGSWHTHPYAHRGRPSSDDRRNALENLSWQELDPAPCGISLVVTPDSDRGWSRPIFHAWVTRRNQFGTAVTEPATIKGS